ncbi:PEP-CTERM/exosortase system-associated acyltransferase [Nitrosovibrio sp. Nv4]|uniref:PEP-CTERM/exosortase system-associated acyltransferase n=1 Tax=Nitrosovibrio sp. Nv4 TaxID=1945880 RepID=UPI000BD6657D|nr:PEP-CTERM/exosortase system-associated acyltransferase [Nitrosovibrio sp. Nv4]SOD40549.1 N-acyl amino acid synthase, PEP-CTERM/exosortase system-associated [Nitrosovibrio sp. Nv4]
MFLPETFNLGNAFKQYFEIVPAFSNALKNEVYRIRHEVYCEDLKFEPARANGQETDEHDANSLHLLMRSVKTSEFVGCTRIIRPSPDNPDQPLPFETTCASTLDRTVIDPATLPRDCIAEVSRLAVIAGYRRRKGEANSAVGISNEDFGTPKQARFPFIPIGLYLGTTELARLAGIETVFVLTEERLANHFGKLGFSLQHIGSPIEHHGRRIPSVMSVSSTIDNMRTNLRPLYQTIAADIKRGFQSQGILEEQSDQRKKSLYLAGLQS